ncbi:hypothetical protein [Vallitalea guaymasensis]|uniref:hypothetical protein n=1 Tax=Vallitalea guaymasensis TaxID=1185412 RepID=UPI000DE3A163|nr:hypothetical protein [Vallitalea guaymasensis]
MLDTIFKRINKKHQLQFFIKDRIKPSDENKNRLIFKIDKLTSENKVKYSVEYFMDIEDVRYLCYLILNDKITNDEIFHKVRGKEGNARAITIKMNKGENSGKIIHYYTIKIDNGSGTEKINGYTPFQTLTAQLFYSISIEDAVKMALAINERITIRYFLYLNKAE